MKTTNSRSPYRDENKSVIAGKHFGSFPQDQARSSRVPNWHGRAYPIRGSSLDATFSALADPTRRAILDRLAKGELSVTQIARPIHMSLPAVSKHLGVLERAGLITREKEGRMYRCRIEATPLVGVAGWIGRYRGLWEKQLDALAEYLGSSEGSSKER